MLAALLTISLLVPFTTPSSLPSLLLPSNLTLSATIPPSNLTARMNQDLCRRDPEHRPLSDYSTCIPSLFRLYATPSIHTPVLWVPGEFKQWGPETDLGGCYMRVDSGRERDVFSLDTLLGPAIWAVGKCFVGEVEGRNRLAKTKVGPRKEWLLSVVLETTRVVRGNESVS